jgi:CTP:molybdopterin cytidylyltransferase MocA
MGGLIPGGDGGSGRPVLVMLAAGVARRYGGCKPLAPVGLHGEAVIDLNAGDALRAGFGEIVLITGPAVIYHVRRTWPREVAVSFALQEIPLGTAHAVLRARPFVGDRSFAAINADDVYGVPALERLADHLRTTADHALVSYQLGDTVVTGDPVTRGLCETDGHGWLRGLVERRQVSRHRNGTFTADDGLEPKELPGDTPTSMNLWGFTPAIWSHIRQAVAEKHPELGPDGSPGAGPPASDAEVLLPEMVGAMVAGKAGGAPVKVIEGTGRCIGVTHADDLPVVRIELAEMVGQGLRAEGVWGAGT